MIKTICRWPYCVIFVLIIISGCNRRSGTETLSNYTRTNDVNTSTSSAVTPAKTETKTIIPTYLKTITPNITTTMTPMVMAATFTPTFRPTLAPEKAQSEIKDLLISNGGCELPCWWGMTPGVTKLNEVRSYLSTFEAITGNYALREDSGMISFTLLNKDRHLDIYLDYGGKGRFLNWIWIGSQSVEPITGGYNLVYGDAFYNQAMRKYILPQVLTDFGKPQRVLVWAPPLDFRQPFEILLDYSSSGFLIGYSLPEEQVGENFVGCPSQAHIYFWLWPKDKQPSFPDMIATTGFGSFDPVSINYYKPIEDVTKFTLDNFFKTFKEPGNLNCIVTPSHYWVPPQ
jgi:hypothetical protein